MEEKKQVKIINLHKLCKKIWECKRIFYITLPIVFVLSLLYILSIPRYYSAETKLAPEIDNSLGNNSISSIASSFGFNLGEMKTSDAITPMLYPDLMEDNGFIAKLFPIQVQSNDKQIKTDYFNYIYRYQKTPWWASLLKKDQPALDQRKVRPYNLSKYEDKVVSAIKNDITIHVNSKNGVITITTKAQDPLICKTLADSISSKLQTHITTYRTNKARTDYAYYKQLTVEARNDYEKARQRYAAFSDASTNAALRSVELKLEEMENDMQLKFDTYTSLNRQLQAAKAKVQERTPAFTVLKGAAVPLKPAGPKRMIFVFVMIVLATIASVIWIIRKNIGEIFI